MYYFRYLPQSSHLHSYEAYMHMRFLTNACQKVQCSNSGLVVRKYYYAPDREWIYFAIDPKLAIEHIPKPSKHPSPAVHGFVTLTKIHRGVGLEVCMSYVNPNFRGAGVAALLYDSILKDGAILVSGSTQSTKARRFWAKLIRNPHYVIWAHDLLNLDRTSQVFEEDGKVMCDLKLYKDIKTKRRKQVEDVRLVAIDPRYVSA